MNTIQIILSNALKILRKTLLFILIIIGLWFSYNLIFHSGKNQCGIVGNRVDIGAPVLIMRVVNGKPDSIRGYGEYARVCDLFRHKSEKMKKRQKSQDF